LTTGVLYKGSNQADIICLGTNVGEKTMKEMTVSFVSVTGTILGSTTCVDLVPGGFCQVNTVNPAHCRIDFKGPKQSARGSASVNNAANDIEVVEIAR
jgi:hypothetical protein